MSNAHEIAVCRCGVAIADDWPTARCRWHVKWARAGSQRSAAASRRHLTMRTCRRGVRNRRSTYSVAATIIRLISATAARQKLITMLGSCTLPTRFPSAEGHS